MNGVALDIAGTITDVPLLDMVEGRPVYSFTVATAERVYSKALGSWHIVTGPSFKCRIVGKPAINASQSLHKGNRVMVAGKLTKLPEGHIVEVAEMAKSLLFGPLKSEKAHYRTLQKEI